MYERKLEDSLVGSEQSSEGNIPVETGEKATSAYIKDLKEHERECVPSVLVSHWMQFDQY